ncbi:MAG TPA: dihydropteroate synthase [Gemmatimonadaceae bacterium]|nr:dihydropteroate synthase [Gemmatimonadaceae bacterium]
MTATPEPPPAWRARGRLLALDRPRILGILNVTPDSFSDGGLFFPADAALARAERLLEEGADIIDIGGESTRPQGAEPVSAAEERRRVVPVVRELRRRWPEAWLSVDTVKAEVAAAALGEGADIINDVAALRLDDRLGELCARTGAGVILMHSRGTVSDMGTYRHAAYGERPVAEILAELRARVDVALAAGIAPESIAVDPGIGFAKRGEHSLALLAALPRLAAWGHPVVVGVSRKRFIGEITGVKTPSERVMGTVGANVVALTRGARLFRVHDVRPSREALDVAWAILRAAPDEHEGAR